MKEKEFISVEAMRYIENNRHRFTSETMARYLKLKVRTVKTFIQQIKDEKKRTGLPKPVQ
jgi:hypothetical protein